MLNVKIAGASVKCIFKSNTPITFHELSQLVEEETVSCRANLKNLTSNFLQISLYHFLKIFLNFLPQTDMSLTNTLI